MQTDPELMIAQATPSAVTVDVSVNDPSHQDAEELNAHISQTQVSLMPDLGGDPIPLEKTGEDELDGTFSAPAIPRGNYTLTANLVTADGGNYAATQPVQVINGENTYNITLTKTEVSG